MNDIAISLDNVNVRYGNNVALENASINIPYHSFTGVIGMNGAGKSTLFKAIMGLVELQTGTITICGDGILRDAAWKKKRVEMANAPAPSAPPLHRIALPVFSPKIENEEIASTPRVKILAAATVIIPHVVLYTLNIVFIRSFSPP